MELLPGIHWIQGSRSNIYLWEKERELILIDAGSPGDAGTIRQYIHELGRRLEELTAILLTHADADHIQGLAKIKQTLKTTVSAHPR